MSRLPIPGQDSGTWGDILNDYLSQSLKPDGTLQDNSVTSNAVAPNSITNAQIASDAVNAASIADGSITNGLIQDGTIQEVKLSSAVQTKLNLTAPVTSVNTKTGVVSLDKSDIGLSDVDNTSDATKNAAIATLTNKTITAPRLMGDTAVAQAGTIALYNTADQTTNYERVRAFWSSNVATITTENAGTGTGRGLYIGVANAGRGLTITPTASTAGRFQMGESTGNANAIGVSLTSTFTATSGTNLGLSVGTTINQSSTAGYTALQINAIETATGSGTKLLADFQLGGVSKFKIDTSGAATVASVGTASGSVVSTDGTQTLTGKTISGSSNTISNIAQSSVTNLTSDLTNKQAKFMTGTVATASGTTAKTVTLDSPWASYTPVSGDIFLITFTNGTSVNSPTLAINGGSALGLRAPNGNTDIYSLGTEAGSAMLLRYDGTYYRLIASQASYGEISATEVIDPAQTGFRAITGRRLEVLMANEATKARTLTNKTISGSTNAITNISNSSLLSLSGDVLRSVTVATDPESSAYFTMVPGIYNDLSNALQRSGSLSVTLNGGAATVTDIDKMFRPGSYTQVSSITSTSDIVVLEVTLPTDITRNNTSRWGITQPSAWCAFNVKIELYFSGSWTSIYDVSSVTGGNHITTYNSFSNSVEKVRYTLTNFHTNVPTYNQTTRISSLYMVNYSSALSEMALLPKHGGRMYGMIRHQSYTTAGRPTASSAGAGAEYFDTTLNKPVYSDGTNWRDAAGTIV